MPKKKIKSVIKPLLLTDLFSLTMRDAIKYVQKLHEHIAMQNKRIGKLKFKITKLKFLSKLDQHIAKTAVEESKEAKQQQSHVEVKADKTPTITEQKSRDEKLKQENIADFVNDIKTQAEINAWNQAGFVFEPTSGLYYDTKSGYYYSPQYDLYYNGTDGNWYRLNPRTKEFIFHSGTDAAAANTTQQQNEKKKKDEDIIDEDEAIRRILEDGRKSSKSDERRRRKYSNSDSSRSSSVSSDRYRSSRRRKYRSKSRSRSRTRRSSKKSKKYRRSRSRTIQREEGECDSSANSSEDQQRRDEIPDIRRRKRKKKGNEYEEIAKKYPPSLRLVVIESDKMDLGTLFMVTYKGGSLGREGKHHAVLIPDVNVSKNHLKLSYDKKRGNYQIIDHSRNGTMLDGKQISSMNQEDSEAVDLFHDNILQISNTKLLCHIHEGLTTCKDCEPFNYSKPPKEPEKVIEDPQPSNLSHKEQLKLLQKRYGLQSEKYQETPSSGKNNKNYEDRAENRRVKVGSSHHAEKTVQASVDTSISSDNKGFKMLSKMGWSEGKSIGKSQEGIKEPVQLKTQQGTSGLGNENSQLSSSSSSFNAKKKAILDKTQKRYNNINENIFED